MDFTILARMRNFGYAASLFVFREEDAFSLVIGSTFDELGVLAFSRELDSLQRRFGGDLDIAIQPRPAHPPDGRIIISFSSKWRLQFDKSTFLQKLQILKTLLAVWQFNTLYVLD